MRKNFFQNNKKIAVISNDSLIEYNDVTFKIRNYLVVYDTETLNCEKKIELNISGRRICSTPYDNSVAIIDKNTINFWDIEKEECYKQIEHTGGLYVIDVELNNLHRNSELSSDAKQKLRQYGAII